MHCNSSVLSRRDLFLSVRVSLRSPYWRPAATCNVYRGNNFYRAQCSSAKHHSHLRNELLHFTRFTILRTLQFEVLNHLQDEELGPCNSYERQLEAIWNENDAIPSSQISARHTENSGRLFSKHEAGLKLSWFNVSTQSSRHKAHESTFRHETSLGIIRSVSKHT